MQQTAWENSTINPLVANGNGSKSLIDLKQRDAKFL
jgi:hypothetical protein